MDPLLHGELCLKHCCLLEAKADSREPPGTVDGQPVTFMHYDRAQLLQCRHELETAINFVTQAREKEEMRDEAAGGGWEEGEGVMREMVEEEKDRKTSAAYTAATSVTTAATSVTTAAVVGGRDVSAELATLHAECLFALTRVQVKLASTNPPPGNTNLSALIGNYRVLH